MSYKTKQFLSFIVKVAVVISAFYFIYQKVFSHATLAVDDFIAHLAQRLFNNPAHLLILTVLSLLNWTLEILKWQSLVAFLKPISFSNASRQSLGSLTASLFTPNRIGEYGAKAIYYKKGNRRKIMLLNLISNMSQMLITVIFGLLGLAFFTLHHREIIADIHQGSWIILTLGGVLIIVVMYFTLKKIRGFYIDKIKRFIRSIPVKTTRSTVLFSLFRYVVFSHQLYYLLWIFEINITYMEAMSAISAMYLIASIIPSLSFFDWLIKGSVAVWIFAFFGAEELVILSLSLVMWLMNFGLPALIGSYYVINFNLNQRE